MGRFRALTAAVLGAASLFVGGASVASADEDGVLLSFHSMAGVTQDQTSIANDRGIVGGGKPWVITLGIGHLSSDGKLHVRVKGLVIPVAPFNGTNPVAQFGVTVSCLTPAIVNVRSTSLFDTGPAGNAVIDTTVDLPSNCMDPIVFVTSPGGAWFARSVPDDEEG
jgi:hypothetical protein